MSLIKTQTLRDAGAVVRYHTARMTRQQTVAEHSYGVAMLVKEVEPGDHLLLIAALHHDLSEAATGDIPAPAKWDNPELSKVLTAIEAKYDTRYGTAVQLSDHQAHVLRWCDTMELVLWCREEWRMGNKYAETIMLRGLDHISHTLGHPNEAAAIFFYDVLQEDSRDRK